MKKPLKISEEERPRFENEAVEVVDEYEYQLDELFQIRNPWTKFNKEYEKDFDAFKKNHLGNKSIKESGEWFYFPWNKTLMHCLPDSLHQEIRTARNKDIITKEEQEILYNTTVAVTGLSVGSHGVLTMSMMGIARHIKLADPDKISPSNLNRLNYDFTKIGKNKAEVLAERIYQMNPYASIDIFADGLTEDNMDSFLSDVSILIEEMDSLPMKILIRKKAKKLGIPVLMATDNGNSVILDVERFDNDHDYPVFHGRVDLMKEGVLLQSNQKQWNRIASEIIGIEFMEENLLLSLAKVGYTISGIPQLASAATSSGAFLAICVVRIATQKTLFSGKYVFSTEAILVPNYLSTASIKRREDIRENFKKFLRS